MCERTKLFQANPSSCSICDGAVWPMSALGHRRTLTRLLGTSALPPKAGIRPRERHVRFAPNGEFPTNPLAHQPQHQSLTEHFVRGRKQVRRHFKVEGLCDVQIDDSESSHGHLYSITSSALSKSDWSIVRRSIFVVLRLTTNLIFVGCSTGRSAGFCCAGGQKNYELSPRHSITSSARAARVEGTAKPSDFAVPALMTISIFVGNSTGKSPGLAPRKIRST